MSKDFLKIHPNSGLPPLEVAISEFCKIAPGAYLGREHEQDVAEMLRSDDLRILTLSRSRYNPRFRGRIVAEPHQAQELLIRVALCVAASVPFRDFSFPSPADSAL